MGIAFGIKIGIDLAPLFKKPHIEQGDNRKFPLNHKSPLRGIMANPSPAQVAAATSTYWEKTLGSDRFGKFSDWLDAKSYGVAFELLITEIRQQMHQLASIPTQDVDPELAQFVRESIERKNATLGRLEKIRSRMSSSLAALPPNTAVPADPVYQEIMQLNWLDLVSERFGLMAGLQNRLRQRYGRFGHAFALPGDVQMLPGESSNRTP